MFKLFKEKKENGKFYKVVVLPCSNDEEIYLDCRNQYYTEEEIAILISTEANNCFFDYNHNNKLLSGIHTVQNYQSKAEEYIDDFRIPVGSWIKIIFSENSCINEKISNGIIKGVSNDFDIDSEKSYCECNKELPPGINTFVYADVPEKECIIQNWLSFVTKPCNYAPIGEYTYEEYKLNNNCDSMKFKKALKNFFKQKEDEKEYNIENSEDVVRIMNEITDDKIEAFKTELEGILPLISEDIEFIQQDLETLKSSVEKALDGDGDEPPEDGEEVDNEGITNSDNGEPEEDKITNAIDKINETLEKMDSKIENLDSELQKRPVIKNQRLINNINKDKPRKGLFNRNKED